jgi:hypothetical protein
VNEKKPLSFVFPCHASTKLLFEMPWNNVLLYLPLEALSSTQLLKGVTADQDGHKQFQGRGTEKSAMLDRLLKACDHFQSGTRVC